MSGPQSNLFTTQQILLSREPNPVMSTPRPAAQMPSQVMLVRGTGAGNHFVLMQPPTSNQHIRPSVVTVQQQQTPQTFVYATQPTQAVGNRSATTAVFQQQPRSQLTVVNNHNPNQQSMIFRTQAAPIIVSPAAQRVITPAPSPQQQQQQQQQVVFNASHDDISRSQSFFSTLLQLTKSQSPQTFANVQALIKKVIVGKLSPREFTDQLQLILRSNPQPQLVQLLERSLPALRQMHSLGKLGIDGLDLQSTPQQSPNNIYHSGANALSPASARPLQQRMMPVHQGSTVANHLTIQQHGASANRVGIHHMQGSPRAPQTGYVTLAPHQTVNAVATSHFAANSGNAPSPRFASTSRLPLVATAGEAAALVGAKTTYRSGHLVEGLRNDELNDVATIGGVNLVEEARVSALAHRLISTPPPRLLKDDTYLSAAVLRKRLERIGKDNGLSIEQSTIPPKLVGLISHATQERLRDLITRSSLVAQNRSENLKADGSYQMTRDIRGQIAFFQKLDAREEKLVQDREREHCLRQAKKGARGGENVQDYRKRAKELQHAQQAASQFEETGLTALAAVGSTAKRRRVDSPTTMGTAGSYGSLYSTGGLSPSQPYGSGYQSLSPRMQQQPSSIASSNMMRLKKVNIRDFNLVMEQQRNLRHSLNLYRSYDT